MQLAERMNRLGSETAFEVLARAKALEAQGRHIIHLEIGEPDFATPAGAFYVFPNIEGTGMSSQDLATYLLDTAGVATLSGASFGRYGEGYLRLSYVNSIENIQQALARLREALAAR